VLAFARGHALALSLVADLIEQAPDTRFSVERAPDVVRALVQQLVRGIPDAKQRAALEACAVARTTTEPLLAALLDSSDVRPLFDWLRGLSFMQSDRVGIVPHDLARAALTAELAFRDPERLRRLKHRAFAQLIAADSPSVGANWRGAAIDSQLNDPLHLADNPLLRSRLAQSRGGDAADAVRTILRETIAALDGSARNRKLREALHATFVEPAGTQEATAEALDLPFSTYRRHLSEGIAEVIDLLWRRESSGGC
jgi:hypothetical protein